MSKSFDKIKEGLEDAIAFARGDESRGKLHTAEEILGRRKALPPVWPPLDACMAALPPMPTKLGKLSRKLTRQKRKEPHT